MSTQTEWHDWYQHFPWEDCRETRNPCTGHLIDALNHWADSDKAEYELKRRRIAFLFGLEGYEWNEDLILQRYELLYEAGLVQEAGGILETGIAMFADHRRILATAIARLRAKIKYRALVFELVPEEFTLLHLQKTVEAIVGRRLHKPNFRRLIEQQGLIEETGERQSETGGRPAKLYRYREAIVEERALAGSKLPLARD